MERETLLLARSGALLTPALRHFHLLSPNFSDLNQSFMQIKKETHSAVTSDPDNDRRCFCQSPSGSWCCLIFWTQPIFERNRGHLLTGSKRIRAEISDTDLKDDKLGGNVVADKGRRGGRVKADTAARWVYGVQRVHVRPRCKILKLLQANQTVVIL